MKANKILADDLTAFCTKTLLMHGLSEEDAGITAKVLVETDTYGTHSHGTKNLRMYIEKIKAGGIDPKARPEVVLEFGSCAVINANDSIGMVGAYRGMQKAIETARKSGISYIGVNNSCHFGAAGYYANMAASQGMIGMAMSNTDPNMSVPGSKSAVIGNSPFSYAVPDGMGGTIFLDIAMSATAALKVLEANRKGEKIPDTWIVDHEGRPSTDPGLFPQQASLQPMAAHKGYGLALMVEILTGVIADGGFLKDITSWVMDLPSKNKVSHAFIVIDINQLLSVQSFNMNIRRFVDEIKNADKISSVETIYLPGEMELERKKRFEDEGLSLPQDVTNSLNQLAQDCGLKINWLN